VVAVTFDAYISYSSVTMLIVQNVSPKFKTYC